MKYLMIALLLLAWLSDIRSIDVKEAGSSRMYLKESTLIGVWVGSLNGRWPIYYEIKRRQNPAKGESPLVSIYHWVSKKGGRFHHSSVKQPVYIVNGEVLLSDSFLESVPGQPGVMLVTRLSATISTTALYRSNLRDINKYADKWDELLKKLRGNRRLITVEDSTAPILLFGYSYTLQSDKQKKSSGVEGINVVGLVPGKPAEKAGMKVGDIVLKINNSRVTDRVNLIFSYRHEKGLKPIPVLLWRNKKKVTIYITPYKRKKLLPQKK